MARPRKPTNVLELKGAFKEHPARLAARANEPAAVDPIGKAPAYLDEAQVAAYDELVEKAHAGVMCSSDGVVVEVGAVLLAKMRANPNAFTAGEFGRLHAILGSLGMTPADRSKVQVLKPKENANPYSKFKPAG